MQKKLIYAFFLIIFCINSNFVLAANRNHLVRLNAKFPYGLLNDDHGILTLRDLARNACESPPIKFLSDEFTPYEYWQCYESKAISFDCDSNGTADEYEGVMGLVVVRH